MFVHRSTFTLYKCSIFSETDFCMVNEQNIRHYHPINCQKYIFCNTHFITEQSCGSNDVYDVPNMRCVGKDTLLCAKEVVESTSIASITQTAPSQSGPDSSTPVSMPHSLNLLSTTMEISSGHTVSTLHITSHSMTTDLDIQTTGTMSDITSSPVQG